jgi:putative restriction endonuclease
MKAVFEISGASRYDDLIAERYHFPSNYLSAVDDCVGDGIVFRETGAAGGRMTHVFTGMASGIDPDQTRDASLVSFYAALDWRRLRLRQD